MPPTCHICEEKYINNNTRCKTCKKCLCIVCYDRVSKFVNFSNDKVLSEYKCHFCNIVARHDLQELGSDILIRFTETAVLNFVAQKEKIDELNEENSSLRDEFDEVLIHLRSSEIQETKDHKDALKYRKLKFELHQLKSKGRKTIRFEEIEKMI